MKKLLLNKLLAISNYQIESSKIKTLIVTILNLLGFFATRKKRKNCLAAKQSNMTRRILKKSEKQQKLNFIFYHMKMTRNLKIKSSLLQTLKMAIFYSLKKFTIFFIQKVEKPTKKKMILMKLKF